MISQLTGKIIEKQPPYLLLDVHGVGYSIACPMTTFYALPKDTSSTTLHTHLVVREDAWQLYGFCNRDERRLFRILIKISGVGPKLALTILSGMELSEFISCIRAGDHQRLVCIPGIGKKTAQRITVEARDAIDKWQCNQTTLLPKNSVASTPKDSAHQPFYEAQRALLALGYKDHETQQMIQKIKAEASDAASTPKVEELIRQALKLLAQKV
jgi:holliday junction DNA helicase RuvA